MKPIIVVGTGLAGYSTARELRRHDRTTPLLLISQDDGCNYYKPDLSEALSKGKSPEELIKYSAEEMAAALDAEIRIQATVRTISPKTREIQVGDESLHYSALVLANGAEPIEVPLSGNGTDAVYSVNNHDDYAALHPRLKSAGRVIVMGAGLIGCEFCNDLASQGISVDCIDPADWPLQRFLPQRCGEAVRAGLAKAGVNWHLGQTVLAVNRDADALCVDLDDGTSIGADVILSAVGLRPSVTLAKRAGLAVAHGVVVDRELRTSDPHIYALGDCAEVDGHFRPFVAPLMQAARALGRTLAGKPARVSYPALPIIVKTPACPTIAYPPPGRQGDWVVEGDAPDLVARCIDADERLMGFALTGIATKHRGRLIKESPPILM